MKWKWGSFIKIKNKKNIICKANIEWWIEDKKQKILTQVCMPNMELTYKGEIILYKKN
jgi:hypothetical protein